MKVNKLVCLFCLGIALMLVGCSKKNSNSSSYGSEELTPEQSQAADQTIVEGYIGLIGKDDATVINMLGDGSKTEVNGTISARDYEVSLFGETIPLSVIYDQGKVIEVSLFPQNGTYDMWQSTIINSLGAPSKTIGPDPEEGNDTHTSVWNFLDGGFRLQSAYGTVFMTVFSLE